MRILVITQYFWPEAFRINDLVEGLVGRGHAVTVLTGIPNYPSGRPFPSYSRPKHENYQGAEVKRCPLFCRREGRGWHLVLNYLSFALSASILGPWLCRGRYDSIFVFEPSPVTVGIPALVMKFFKRVPLFFWVQDLWPESLAATGAIRSPLILRAVGHLVRAIYARCDRVLVQSRAFIPAVEAMGAEKDKIRYFPNSAEKLYTETTVRAVRENPGWGEGVPEGFRILFAGNIGAAQDFATLLRAAELVSARRDIHWLIVGDGRLRAWAEAETDKRGLRENVHFLGRFPMEKMPAFFAASDALLVTLKKDPIFALTIPSKVQSYLAAGRPILAALDGEGARVIAEARAGICCPTEDPEALARAAERLAGLAPDVRLEMGREGHAYFQREFNSEMLLSTLESEMLSVIAANGPPKLAQN